MVHLLHIDTSGETGTIALSSDGIIVSSVINTDTRNHAASINLQIDGVLKDAGIIMQDIDAIAICGGPGSYTGLRIGLSTAKGLCYVLSKPLMMHNTLRLLNLTEYYECLHQYDYYLSILIARDKEYYLASYCNNSETGVSPRHIFEEELPQLKEKMSGKLLLTGDINHAINNIFSAPDSLLVQKTTIDVHSWAKYCFEQYNCNSFVNLEYAEPFYLKQVYTHNQKKSN